MLRNLTELPVDKLLGVTQRLFFDGYRFVTASCVENGDGMFDIIYHFDKGMELVNYRVTVGKDDEVPSISSIYLCSLLVENEIKELFGVNITDIAIDYGGHLLLSEGAPSSPMAGGQITVKRL